MENAVDQKLFRTFHRMRLRRTPSGAKALLKLTPFGTAKAVPFEIELRNWFRLPI
jgi:hypothetical protein